MQGKWWILNSKAWVICFYSNGVCEYNLLRKFWSHWFTSGAASSPWCLSTMPKILEWISGMSTIAFSWEVLSCMASEFIKANAVKTRTAAARTWANFLSPRALWESSAQSNSSVWSILNVGNAEGARETSAKVLFNTLLIMNFIHISWVLRLRKHRFICIKFI